MASFITKGPQFIQNENLNIPQKKVVDVKTETTKKKAKKGGPGLGSRKALKDITNKSSISQKVSKAKQKIHEEEFNIEEEGFLHDHNKCIAAQKNADDVFLLDLVLPRYASVLDDKPSESDQLKAAGFGSPLYLSEMEESPMEWFSPWKSPPHSPRHSYSPPDTPFSMHYEPVKFTLKDEDDI